MANLTIYLDTSKKDKEGRSYIMYDIKSPGVRIRRSLKIKTQAKHWDEQKERVKKPSKKEPDNDYVEKNSTINDLKSKVEGIFNEAKFYKIILTKKFILERLDLNEENPIPAPSTSLLEAYDKFIEVNKPVKAERTIQNYINLKNFLKDYSKIKNVNLDFDNIDKDWFESFLLYCYNEREKPTADNYFAKHISTLKTFMKWANDKNYTQNLKFLKFTAPERDTSIVCLELKELLEFYHYPFLNKEFEHIRDIFCFACFTGLRISDVLELRKEHIVNGAIQKDIIKVKGVNVIPLIKPALAIINKYTDYPGRKALPYVSKKFNQKIKEVAKEADLKRSVITFKYIGGKPIYKTSPLHKVISAHIARKTFITTSLQLGMPRDIVKAISGHKKDANFNKYVKFAEITKKEAMDKAWADFE